ncbi:alkaline serine protease [Diplogelasinospora grovesii]|uniref:tripeptidyl-peptidase II n=1 Tax=Diplogelasinospora grovesii TaxID=303347 RepID=A0AAN6N1P1_9PEZI|nr:alkaline serine protease [Diplogelasinospora grovesii]
MLPLHIARALAGGLALGAAASPLTSQSIKLAKKRDVPASHTLHERAMPHWSNTWTKTEKLPSDALLPMRIGLKQSNLDIGHNMLMDISDPTSRNFGKHLSPEEVIESFSPPEHSVQIVTDWVASAGIAKERVSQSANKQWIQFDADAAEVEDLLLADFYVFEHLSTGTKNVACDEYHVPKHIQEHIDYITPGIRLRAKKTQKKPKRAVTPKHGPVIVQAEAADLPPLNASVCYKYVTPECVKAQYSIPEGKRAAEGNELGIFESLGDHYSKNDLDYYFSNIYPKISNGTYPKEQLIDGATGAAQTISQIGTESDLDFQAAMPLIWPQTTVLYQADDQYYEINQTTPDTPYIGFWNTFYDALDGSYCNYSAFGETGNCEKAECLDPVYPNPDPGGYKGQLQCGVYKPTNVISISYGGGEADLPAYYGQRQCSEIMKLGLQGVTVVISSGDYGVAGYEGDGGYANGCAGTNNRVFYPSGDATCPYVLAVGSTELVQPNSTAKAPCKFRERSTRRFPSGGGFSNVFDTPDYQKSAVQKYFDTVKLNFSGYTDPGQNFSSVGAGVYRIGGRGYPDVAAIGDNYVTRANNSWHLYGGTSLSTPIWAAMLTLVNEERLALNKSTIGFINPILYSHPEVFSDITEGSNPGCNSTGFLAARGWDPVSGLGTPKFPRLLSLLMNLP